MAPKEQSQTPTTTVTVRIENKIFEKVKEYSIAERRSINAEINVLLEEALSFRKRCEEEEERRKQDVFPY